MRRPLVALILLVLLALSQAGAQTIKEMEFKEKPITDILLALAQMSGTSIIPDDTVSGNASYFFSNTTLNTALKLFLSTYGYYYWKSDGVYYVSRVHITYDRTHDLVTADARNVAISKVVRTLSNAIGRTILYDALPDQEITLHAHGVSPAEVLKILLARFPDYTIQQDRHYFYIKRKPPPVTAQARSAGGARPAAVAGEAGAYSINARQIRFRDAVRQLFKLAGKEYSMLGQSDPVLQGLYFRDKTFAQLLRLIVDEASADYTQVGNVYYIFDIQRRDVLNQLFSTVVVPLKHIAANDLPTLLPSDLASSGSYKVDSTTNSIVLHGSLQQIAPIQAFIKKVDQPLVGKSYYRFDLAYMNVQDFMKLLPSRLANPPPIVIPHTNSFVMLLSPPRRRKVESYVALVDRRRQGVPIRLQFIQSANLLKNLPPSIDKSEITPTANPSLVFFDGTEQQRKLFMKELAAVDRPIPQIKYELLVIQHQEGRQLSHDFSLSNNVLSQYSPSLGTSSTVTSATTGSTFPATAFLGNIGKLLSLSFDVVSTFGYLFALNLNASLGNAQARVLADTTLNGLSGQSIKFQNTETYRYRDTFINPDTGKVDPNGVVREITSGLIVDINGWVSGDGMITMNVAATISKQGTSSSTSAGSLPPTSEKIVNTQVRTASGSPVVIGGLIEQDTELQLEKTPLLARIPILGKLFEKKTRSVQNTRLDIYILPHIEYRADMQVTDQMKLRALYDQFVKGTMR